jgi:predicted  nucleic acid-binding Zn-ribbon protein
MAKMGTRLIYLILLAMGFLIVILAFLIRESWRIKQAEVKVQKLGLDLKVQNNILIAILGFVLLCGSGYFFFKSDQEAIEKAKERTEQAEREVKAAQDSYEREMRTIKENYNEAIREVRDVMLKEYQLEMNLLFEGVENKSPLDDSDFYQDVHIKCCVKTVSGKEECVEGEDLASGKKGMRAMRQLPYGVKLMIEKIRVQEQVEINAQYTREGKTYFWRGGLMLPTVDMKLYQCGR